MSCPVIAILLSCSTTACSECATDASNPPGISWAAVACNKVNCGKMLVAIYASFHAGKKIGH